MENKVPKTSSKKSKKVLLEKKDRTGRRWVRQIHFWSPGPLGWKVSRQKKHKCLRTGKKCREGLGGEGTEWEKNG